MSYNKICLLLIISCAFACCKKRTNDTRKDALSLAEANVVHGKIIGIKDGDTAELLADGKPIVIRLKHIDCPERGQPYSKNAKQYLSQLCFGQNVTVVGDGEYDGLERLLGESINERQQNCNLAMVEAGWAWHFTVYSSDTTYAHAQTRAQVAKLGMWASPHPVAPWLWRKGDKR